MQSQDVIRRCTEIYRTAGRGTPPALDLKNILSYTEEIGSIIRYEWSAQKITGTPWLKEFSDGLKRIRDAADTIVKADPMVLYTPAHDVAEQFHRSQAWTRTFWAGRRTSKTQCGYVEDYWYATGQHPYRMTPVGQSSVLVISYDFTNYQKKVFEAKFLNGEAGNEVLTPMFPEGGKWFYHWDPKHRTILLACKACAEAGKAGSCKHPKSSISLFSAETGKKVMEGFVGSFLHCDEDVPEDMFNAALQRLTTVKNSSVILTGSPNAGPDAWQLERFYKPTVDPTNPNLFNPDDADSVPYCSYHTIDQFEAGLADHTQIKAQMRDYDDFEKEVYVYGRPAILAKKPVFSRDKLAEMRRSAKEPVLGDISHSISIVDLDETRDVQWREDQLGHVRCWEFPKPDSTYIIGADAAQGLFGGAGQRKGDPSCATVLKVCYDADGRLQYDLVAQYHGWCNVLDYADVLKRLGLYYNAACVVLELTGGHGRATMLRLKRELLYANIFIDTETPEITEEGIGQKMGLDTNVTSKPAMVGALQNLIKTDRIRIPCAETIKELTQFEQENGASGNVRYRGAQGSHDDRVMSLAMAVYAPLVNPLAISIQEMAETATSHQDVAKAALENLLGVAISPESWDNQNSW